MTEANPSVQERLDDAAARRARRHAKLWPMQIKAHIALIESRLDKARTTQGPLKAVAYNLRHFGKLRSRRSMYYDALVRLTLPYLQDEGQLGDRARAAMDKARRGMFGNGPARPDDSDAGGSGGRFAHVQIRANDKLRR